MTVPSDQSLWPMSSITLRPIRGSTTGSLAAGCGCALVVRGAGVGAVGMGGTKVSINVSRRDRSFVEHSSASAGKLGGSAVVDQGSKKKWVPLHTKWLGASVRIFVRSLMVKLSDEVGIAEDQDS